MDYPDIFRFECDNDIMYKNENSEVHGSWLTMQLCHNHKKMGY